MQIHENISLKPYNTFGIDAYARYFGAFDTVDSLNQIINNPSYQHHQLLIIGGGSNILFTSNFDGLVLKNDLKGIEVVDEDDDHFFIRAAAGENWHQFVLHCIDNDYAGVENLSLIPGNVGASPMQNIGAYGVEIKDVFHTLEAYNLQEQQIETFDASACEFGYRESVFKGKLKGKYIITSVTFKLKKRPAFNTSYGAIQQELNNMNVNCINIKNISQAVINIRSSKLPDPEHVGNAGSFFKNPTIAGTLFEQIKTSYPNIVGYPVTNGNVKVAAGWLIEQCGWKGFRKGDAGCHFKQALVLVNFANASGNEVYDLSTDIIESVYQKFDIKLEREVNIL